MNGLNMLDGDEQEHTLEQAIAALPLEKGVAVGRIAMKYQRVDTNDPAGLLVNAAIDVEAMSLAAAAATEAAASAAKEVTQRVGKIPDEIYRGAIRAGDEIKGALAAEIRGQGVEVGQALRLTITDASNKGAVALKAAADDLDIKLGKIPAEVQTALVAYREKGVAEFAHAAKTAALEAVKTNVLLQLSRSAMVSIMAFLFAALIGAGSLWGWLLITHRVMPQGVVALADPLRGGTLLMVPEGGRVVHNCPSGFCLAYKSALPDLP